MTHSIRPAIHRQMFLWLIAASLIATLVITWRDNYAGFTGLTFGLFLMACVGFFSADLHFSNDFRRGIQFSTATLATLILGVVMILHFV